MIGNIAAGLFGVGVPPVTSSYESIATSIVGAGGTNTVTFSSIPSTYKHLQIRAILKNGRTSAGTSPMYFTFNGDSTTSYASHVLYGNGASAVAEATSSQTRMTSAFGIGIASGYDNVFTGLVADILDYATTTKNKTMKTLFGSSFNNDQLDVGLGSGLYYKTDAITSISITSPSTPLQQYSHFALFGIKD